MKKTNQLISGFLKKQKKASFVDIFSPMLGSDGKPDPDLFIEDKLHLNEKGYALWEKIIRPFIL